MRLQITKQRQTATIIRDAITQERANEAQEQNASSFDATMQVVDARNHLVRVRLGYRFTQVLL